MKYFICILTTAIALLGLTEYPGWPVEIIDFGGENFYGSPLATHLDYDGMKEIIVAGPDNNIRIFEETGTAYPGSPFALSGDIKTHLAMGPIRGTWDDMVVVTVDGEVYVMDFFGNIADSFPVDIGAAPGPAGPVLWDFDDDSESEIVIHAGENLHVLNSDGTEMSGFPVAVSSEYGPAASPAVGDIDSDGSVEIFAVGYTKIYGFTSSGSGILGFPIELDDDYAFSYSSPILADFDNDGNLEIACGYHSIAGSNSGYIGLWDHEGEMIDLWPINLSGYGSWVYSSPAAGDIDGDRLPEIICAGMNGKGYVLNHDGSALDPWSVALGIGAMESSPLICDIAGDAGPDILFLGNDTSGSITSLNATGSVLDSFPLTGGSRWKLSTALITDIETDGYPEICALDSAGYLHIWSYISTSHTYARPWRIGRHDPLRTGWLHPEPPETVIVEAIGDSYNISWSRSEPWDFAAYKLYNTADANDSSGGIHLITTADSFFTVCTDSVDEYFFVTVITPHIEGERSAITTIDTLTSIAESSTPEEFEINISPNPFNSMCKIQTPGECEIHIFDIQGKEIVESYISRQSQFIWAPSDDVASGVYLINLIKGDIIIRKKVVLMK